MKATERSERIRKYLRVALIGFVAAVVAAYFAGFTTAENAAGRVQAVCDGLFVAAVLLIGGGGIALSSNEGTFDGIRYGFSLVLNVMKPGRYEKRYDSYYAYKESRKSNKLEWLHIMIVGCGYLAAALIMLVVYTILSGQ